MTSGQVLHLQRHNGLIAAKRNPIVPEHWQRDVSTNSIDDSSSRWLAQCCYAAPGIASAKMQLRHLIIQNAATTLRHCHRGKHKNIPSSLLPQFAPALTYIFMLVVLGQRRCKIPSTGCFDFI
jgi:hypothetical protein